MSNSTFPADPALATRLTDARLQVHHAAQLVVAAGISYLPHQPDDSHTNLEWIGALDALASRVVPSPNPFRLAVRVPDLSLLVLDDHDAPFASRGLNGETIASAASWLRTQIAVRAADASRFTLDKHYTVPDHAVDHGAAFNVGDSAAVGQLARWFGGAHEVLQSVRATYNGAEVRCWPHHFDIATLLDGGGGTTIGVGMEPGDVYYDEPYYYVNLNPPPSIKPTAGLAGNGFWHTHEWFGAVLPGSKFGAAEGQRGQVQSFIASAISIYQRALTKP